MATQQSLLLPQAIIEEEVLSRLPVKSLLRFRCVSKSWRSLIDSKRFIRTHLQNSTKNTRLPHRKVLDRYGDGRMSCFPIYEYPLLSFLGGSYTFPRELKSPTNLPPCVNRLSFVGCCNGLVCIFLIADWITLFILWNPSTGTTRRLPAPPALCKYPEAYGFGWDEPSDDYKIIAVVGCISQSAVSAWHMFSLKADSWKTVDGCSGQNPWLREQPAAVLAGGKLHWGSECGNKNLPYEWEIVCFDLSREVFELVEQPCYNEGQVEELILGEFGDFLAVLCEYSYWSDIWVMKEYGVKESWVKVVVVDHDYYPFWTSPSVASLCKQGDNALLVRLDKYCWQYCWRLFNVKRSRFQDLETWPFEPAAVYIESLVSPLD